MPLSTVTSFRGAAFELAGEQLEATHEFEELVSQRRLLVHAERQCMIRPGAVHVHRDLRVGASGNSVEQNGGDPIVYLRKRAGRGGKVRLELDLVLDTQKLALLLEHRQKFAKVFVASHRFAPRVIVL